MILSRTNSLISKLVRLLSSSTETTLVNAGLSRSMADCVHSQFKRRHQVCLGLLKLPGRPADVGQSLCAMGVIVSVRILRSVCLAPLTQTRRR
jgi:hypothetical protein